MSGANARSRKRYGSFWWYQTFILPDVNDRLWSGVAAGTAPPASLKSIATFWDFPAVTGRHGGRQLLSEAGTQVKLLAKAKDRQCSHVSRIASGFRRGPKPANKPEF